MATYTVTTSNWNSAAFWSGINESSGGHTLDFSGLGTGYSVEFDVFNGEITLSDGTDTFVVGDAVSSSADAYMGGSTVLTNFSTVLGSEGEDTLISGTGSDTLIGGGGSDTFVIGTGNETITGGETGNDMDVVDISGADDALNVTFTGNEAGTYADSDGDSGSFSEVEGFFLSSGDDSIDASAATSEGVFAVGRDGDDSLTGGGGDDTFVGGAGADILTGNGGSDSLSGGLNGDTISAGDGADSVDGGSGSDEITLGAGDDIAAGGSGRDTISGGEGNDTIYGEDADIGIDAGTLASFDFSTISDSGNTGTGVIGEFAVYDNIGTTSDGTVVQARMTVLDADDPNIEIDFRTNSVYLNENAESAAGSGVTLGFEFFDQATGEPIQISGGFTFHDVDTTAESVTALSADVTSVTLSASPVSNLTPSDSGEQLAAASDGTSSGNADENHWAQFTYEGQQQLVFEVTSRGAGTNYAFSTDGFSNPGATTYATPENQDDSIDGGAGDDLIYGMAGNDTLNGDDGQDTLNGGVGDDEIDGGADEDVITFEDGFGNDTVAGGEAVTTGTDFDRLDLSSVTGNGVSVTYSGDEAGAVTSGTDSIDFTEIEAMTLTDQDDVVTGGTGSEVIDAGAGDDTLSGAAGVDDLSGGAGDDSLDGGLDGDTLDGGAGRDTLIGGGGDDIMTGGDDQDRFRFEDGFGNDTVTGGEGGTDEDTLDLSALTSGATVDLSGSESGSVTSGADTIGFAEIERVDLGAGRDTVVLADGSGSDTVGAFDLTDSGDGSTNDQLDVTGLTSDGGTTPVNVGDVVVSDDGSGNAVLTFPGGEAITLVGVAPADVDSTDELESIGIPAVPSAYDYVVEGTAADDTIDSTYTGDPQDDMIDAGDHSDSSDADLVYGHGGDDLIQSGADADTVFGGTGADTIEGGTGADELHGDAGDDSIDIGGGDTITGDDGDDFFAADSALLDGTSATVTGGENAEIGGDTLTSGDYTGSVTVNLAAGDPEAGTMQLGTTTVTFSEIEHIDTGDADDSVVGGSGDDTVSTGDGADTVEGGAGNDSFDIGAGDGEDDLIRMSDGDGNDTITGFEAPTDNGDGTYSPRDLLDLSGLTDDSGNPISTEDIEVTDTNGDGTGDAILTFPDGTSLTLAGVPSADVEDKTQLFAMGVTLSPGDFIVEGTGGDDLIDESYSDDPEGDYINNNDHSDGSNDDVVYADSGNDTVLSGEGNDSIEAEEGHDSVVAGIGDDTIRGGDGNDTVLAGDGDDSVRGGDGDDSLIGGDGSDSLYGEVGEDYVEGGAGDDTLEGNEGEDTLIGGAGNDWMRGSYDNDALYGGEGDDYLWGGFGDDTFHIENNFGNDTIDAEGVAETDGDTLDLSAVTDALRVDISEANAEAGTVSDGTSTLNFDEIENIILGSGTDTLVLKDLGGSDTVSGFASPTDNGDGTYSGNDLLDVTGLHDDDGNPVNTDDVVVSDDGSGNAVLTFPGMVVLTLDGVAPTDVATPAQLNAIGIPMGTVPRNDYVVSGTAAGEVIDTAYGDDPHGDMIDNADHSDGSDDDSVEAGAGDDTVIAGAGDDTVHGEDGDDVFVSGSGLDNDSLIGGETGESDGDIVDLSAISDDLTVAFSGDEVGTATDGTGTLSFEEIEQIELGAGDDSVVGSDGADSIAGNGGADTITGGAGDDTIALGASDGVNDELILDDGFGDDLIEDFEAPTDNGDGTYGGNDQLDVSALTDAGGDPVDTDDVTVGDTIGDGTGDAVLTFPNGESVTLVGVPVGEVNSSEQLAAIGIPLAAAPADYVVSGTSAGEVIDTAYLGDPHGDQIDNADHSDGSDDDSVEAGEGDDTIYAAQGDDTVHGEGGDDRFNIEGGLDNDSLIGGETGEVLGDEVNLSDLTDDLTVTYSGDEVGTITDGTDTTSFEEIERVVLGAGDDSVTGSDGDDIVLGNAGLDTMDGGAGDDVIEGGAGFDQLNGGDGDDTVLGQDGADFISITGTLDNDSIVGGEVDDDTGDWLIMDGVSEDLTVTYSDAETGTVTNGTNTTSFEEIERFVLGAGDDSVLGSDEAEILNSFDGDDTVEAGGGDDTIQTSRGDDSIDGGAGDDSLYGGDGSDTIEGGSGDDLVDLGADDGVADEVVFSDGDGNDILREFSAPTDNGDGTYTGNDQLDVSGLTDAGGDPVNTDDVTVSETFGDGSGDAVLTFPNGETVTLVGVTPDEVQTPEQLNAIGIPLAPSDPGPIVPTPGIVEGDDGDNLIDDAYSDDPDGDMVDNGDGPGGSDVDTITAGAGDDTVNAGADDDSVLGEAGDDVLNGEAGDDTLDGGDGRDTLIGGAGDDDMSGGADEDFFTLLDGFGSDTIDGGETGTDQDTIDASGLSGPLTVTYTGDEAGTISDGTDTATFTGIETILLNGGSDSVDGSGDDSGLVFDGGDGDDTLGGGSDADALTGGSGDDSLLGNGGGDMLGGGDGSDLIDGGDDNDTLTGGDGTDALLGGDGDDDLDGGADNDTLTGGDGADTMDGGAGDDVLNVGAGDEAIGGDGDDVFNATAEGMAGGNATVTGGEGDETLGDTLNITGPATITMTGAEAGNVEWLDGSVLSFSQIENVNYVPCFTPGTLIKTVRGEVDVAEIAKGDVILTRDNGYQTVRWAGSKVLDGDDIATNPALQPIRIAKGALGKGMPERDMVVSPQHRVVMSGYAIELLFGEDEVLVAATHLVGRPGITRECPTVGVTYVHFMFDRHELVMSDGTWTESFQPGDLSLAGLDMDQREELLMLFPQLVSPMGREAYGAARMSLKAYQARLLAEV